jgi:hypothetical protein
MAAIHEEVRREIMGGTYTVIDDPLKPGSEAELAAFRHWLEAHVA